MVQGISEEMPDIGRIPAPADHLMARAACGWLLTIGKANDVCEAQDVRSEQHPPGMGSLLAGRARSDRRLTVWSTRPRGSATYA